MNTALYYIGGLLVGYYIARYHHVSWWFVMFGILSVVVLEFLLFSRIMRKRRRRFFYALDRGLLHIAEFFFGPRESWRWWQRRIERYRQRNVYDP